MYLRVWEIYDRDGKENSKKLGESFPPRPTLILIKNKFEIGMNGITTLSISHFVPDNIQVLKHAN